MDVKVLRQIIVNHFDEEELRTLCFDLDIEYGSLRGDGKAAKARELVSRMKRESRLTELVDAVIHARPRLVINWDFQRFASTKQQLLNNLQPSLLGVFQEFTAQVDAYLTLLTQLHNELEEWKELHNALHRLHSSFGFCRSYAMQIENSTRVSQRQQEQWMYQAEGSWKICSKLVHIDIKPLAGSVQWISEHYDPTSGNGPEWFFKINDLSASMDSIFKENDVSKVDLSRLAEDMFAFDDAIEEWLLQADTNLRKVVRKINQLQRPLLFWDKRDD